MKPYKLMSTLYAHTADVKGLCATKNNGFISVSRDLNAKIWEINSSNQYTEINAIKAHKKYVNAVTVIYTVNEYPDGLIITGSNDQSICIYDIKSNSVIAQVVEHSGAVCTLSCTQSNLLYSGSFDCSAKVWNLADISKSTNLKSMLTLKGHSHTVWSVLPIPHHHICLTGSADKLIKQWRGGESTHTYRGHTDCVRGLAINEANKDQFFSCSNDGTVIQWIINNPTPIKRYNITESFLYSICILNNSNASKDCLFATSGEDRSLRINDSSKGDSSLQTITLPSQSLWNCICLPNNDIVVACSDGTIRIFTQDESRMASRAERDAFEQELSSFAIATKTDATMSQINRSELPGIEALGHPGKKDGQTLMINNENEVEVYTWSQDESRWIKIGVAVGSATSAGGSSSTRAKTMFEGKEYDYVFDISLDDEGTSLKLPYNLSEDPWFAAQNFIHKHELNQLFLDQIAQFIINNTQGETITTQSSGFVDPFTGESSYRPGGTSNALTNQEPTSYYDPFTGENRYRPANSSGRDISHGPANTFHDPFTGAGAYRSGGASASSSAPTQTTIKKHANEFFPQPSFILFDQKNVQTILNKIKEFQAKNNTNSDIMELIENLANSNKVALNVQVDTLLHLTNDWSNDTLFPLLDLMRVVILDADVQKYISNNQLRHLEALISKVKSNNLTNAMLILRVFCNLFSSYENKIPEIYNFLIDKRVELLNEATIVINNENVNKAFQISYTTLLINYAILLNKIETDKLKSNDAIEAMKVELLHCISGELINPDIFNWDLEATFRLLVAIGTLVCDNSYLTTIAKTIVDLKRFILNLQLQGEKNLPKVNSCLQYLRELLNI